jgi:tetratricopeptide (TPR) repeat protein
MPELRNETKEFFHMLHKYLYCREQMDAKYAEIDEYQNLAQLDVTIDSGGIEMGSDDPLEYKQQYQQQSIAGEPVATFEELYKAAEIAKPVYERIINELVDRISVCGDDNNNKNNKEDVTIEFAALKGRERAVEKADDDYMKRKPPAGLSWVYDIVRGSIQFATAEKVQTCIELMQQDPSIRIVKAKNRFQNPSLTGYRDFNLHIQIDTNDGFKHFCEIQIHHQEMKELNKELNSHMYYEHFRSYFAGATGSLKERLEDLKLISNGTAVDEAFLNDLLAKAVDVTRLDRLAKLFHFQLCEYDWALRVNEEILELQRITIGDDHIDVASTYNNMGDILRDQGKPEQALELHTKALAICQKSSGEKPLSMLADTYTNMANALYYQDKLEEALSLYEQALDILKKNEANNQFSIGTVCNNMANIHYEKGNRERALDLYELALDIYKSTLGTEHPSVAETYANMANVLFYKGQLEDALDLLRKVLDIRQKTLGENHRTVTDTYKKIANVYSNLALRLQTQGRLEKSLELYEEELEIRRKLPGNGNSHDLKIADVYSNMALVLDKQDKIEEASEMLTKALDIRSKELGAEHQSVTRTNREIAQMRQRREVGEQRQRVAPNSEKLESLLRRSKNG